MSSSKAPNSAKAPANGSGSGSGSLDPPARDPSTGKAKPGRSRAACSACRANKQKCDGAIRHPCRRCELYNLECDAPHTAANSAGVAHPSTASITMPNTMPYGPRPTPSLTLPSIAAVTFGPSATIPAPNPEVFALAATLREITDRLRQIENGLEDDRRARATNPNNGSSNTLVNASRQASTVPASLSRLLDVDPPPDSNPVQVLVQTIDKIEALSHTDSPSDEWAAGEEKMVIETPNASPPDAIVRGLVTISEAEAAFEFFYERIAPWVMVFGDPDDRIPTAVQARSPFLFHVILLITNYYTQSSTPRAREVYRGLTELVNVLLAHQILAADPSDVHVDLIRGLLLIIYYKPVQHLAYAARGIVDTGRATHQSKVNTWSSIMIHSLIHRTAEAIGLPRSPQAFIAAVEASRAPGGPPVGNEALRRLRTHYALCVADVHGSLQSGRVAATDPTAALETTRILASLNVDPVDARMSAQLELYAIVRTPRGQNPFKLRLAELARINEELDNWEAYWRPILAPKQTNGDPLAYTVIQNAANFVCFTANSAVFTRWTIERQRSLDNGGNGRPTLTTSDWAHLQRATDSAMKTIFALSVESRASGDPLRTCRWADSVGGMRPPLTLDTTIVEVYRTSLDTYTCISFVYSLLLLVRMASAGLISCNLVCRRSDYEAGADLDIPQPLTNGGKLPILLELGATFLRAISPNAQHPARKHSILLHMILKAGLGEHTPAGANAKSSPSGTSPATMAALNMMSSRPSPPAGSTSTSSIPKAPPMIPARAQVNPPSLDAWLFDLTAPNLPVSSDGGALLIPAAPGDAMQQPGEALRSILTEVNPSFFGMGAVYPDELDQFTSMDWGAL